MKSFALRFLLTGFITALGLWLCGCASGTETDNLSERPWNAPRDWEHGLPGGMTEGR